MIVAGFGWRQGATPASLRAALAAAQSAAQQVAKTAGVIAPPGPLVLLASAEDKADAPCLQLFAAELKLPVCAVPLACLEAMPTLTRSAAVLRRRGSGSVAEATALAAAESLLATTHLATPATARLLHPRAVSPDRLATCALATCPLVPEPTP